MLTTKLIEFLSLDEQTTNTWAKDKVPFYFDLNGNSKTFFDYHGEVFDSTEYINDFLSGKISEDDIQEEFMDVLERCMKSGKTICLFMDDSVIGIDEIFKNKVPSNLVNPTKFMKEGLGKNKIPSEGFKFCCLVKRAPEEGKELYVGNKFDITQFSHIRVE